AVACGTVRGKPSSTNPICASAAVVRSRTTPIMTSSGTSWPASMIWRAWSPSGVPRAAASRSTSPVEISGQPRSSASRRPCVPLPTPGGPSSTMRTFVLHPLPAANPAALHETFVVRHEQVRLHLLQRVQRDADDDQHRGAAEAEERHAGLSDDE